MDSPPNSTKPTLLLHMGPPKTSTSFLQCVLTNIMDTLALDDYVCIGTHLWICKNKDIQYNPDEWNDDFKFPFEKPKRDMLSPRFVNELRNIQSQGKNAVILSETFWGYNEVQRKLLNDEFSTNWNVKLVLNYRRAYEFLPLHYSQMHKPSKYVFDPSLTLWPGETSDDGHFVGRPLLPFNIDEGSAAKQLFDDMETKGLHPVEIVRQKYAFPGYETTIIKLHELNRTGMSGDAVLEKMFCHIVGDTMPHSCAAVQLDETVKVGELNSNPYYSFNYDMLATAAYEKHLFGFQKNNTNEQTPLLRRDVADLIQHYQEETLHLTHQDFSSICLDKATMDRILDATINSEKMVYGSSNWTPEHEIKLRQDFLDYQEKRPYIYCWIDTEKTLQDLTWLAFFDSI